MTLEFDAAKSFDDNLIIFLSHLDGIDPQMAKLLREQVEAVKIVDNDEKRRAARTQINTAINLKLDEVPPAEET